MMHRRIALRAHSENFRGKRASGPVGALEGHLNADEVDKGRDLIEAFAHRTLDFLESHPDWYDHVTNHVGTDPDDSNFGFYVGDWMRNAMWSGDLPDGLCEDFYEWGMKNLRLGQDPNTPSWHFMDYRRTLSNPWLIHFSDRASAVAKSGFEVGVPDMTKLGLTRYLDVFERGPGFNFAYETADYARYGKNGGAEWKYGDAAVVFQASSAVKVYHWGDEEPQVIFWGPDATNRHLVSEGPGGVYVDRDEKFPTFEAAVASLT